MKLQKEQWSSKMGAILAVAGMSVGLGNFLRFPGQVAQHGGGAFMIAYFTAMLFFGLPLAWAEWALGREAGARGVHAAPQIMRLLTGRKESQYAGVLGTLVCLGVYMYYMCVESWCLGYFVNSLLGNLSFQGAEAARAFFFRFVGIHANGSGLRFAWDSILPYFLICTGLNIYLLKKGIAKGVERFVRWAAPLLFVLSCLLLLRVITLGTPDATQPERNIKNGLGFMFNPTQYSIEHLTPEGTWTSDEAQVLPYQVQAAQADPKQRVKTHTLGQRLLNPELWLAATGQVFFSLSIGIFQVLTYATFLRRNSDVVLSALTALSMNLFCEICFGGLIAIPAAVALLGTEHAQDMKSLFSLGFKVFPLVFEKMLFGGFFRAIFFFILFIASVTTSLAFSQPGIALVRSAFKKRLHPVWGLMFFLGPASFFVVYFSKDLKAMDTADFWVGSFMLLFTGMLFTLYISWGIGGKAILRAAKRGALITLPKSFAPTLTFMTPLVLIVIFLTWCFKNFIYSDSNPYIQDLFIRPHPVALLTASLLLILLALISWLSYRANTIKKGRANEEGL